MIKDYAGIFIIKVLDTDYTIYVDNNRDYLDKFNADAVTDEVAKTIHIYNIFLDVEDNEKSKEELFKREIRHEIIHAFIYECGLSTNISEEEGWPASESMVDFWASQYYKIGKIFEDAYSIIKDLKKFSKQRIKKLKKINNENK